MLPDDLDPRIRRWFYIWITTGVVVLLAVVALLIPTFLGVEGIPDNLGPAGVEVAQIGEDVNELPDHLASVNAALAGIAGAVAPLDRLTRRTVGNLGSIRSSLVGVETRLNTTTELLEGTYAALVSTAGTLQTITFELRRTNALADTIAAVLHGIRATDGTEEIAQRVSEINAQLIPIHGYTAGIVSGLQSIDSHLESACRALPVGAVAPPAPSLPPLTPEPPSPSEPPPPGGSTC